MSSTTSQCSWENGIMSDPEDTTRSYAHAPAPRRAGACMEPPSPCRISEDLCRCAVCFDVMLGKIAMCPEGHAICSDGCFSCLPTPRRCPSCRTEFADPPTRGLVVEQIIAAARWQCKFGCGLDGTGVELSRHHAKGCSHQLIGCPRCSETMLLHELRRHFAQHSRHLHGLDIMRKPTIEREQVDILARMLATCDDSLGMHCKQRLDKLLPWTFRCTSWELPDQEQHSSIIYNLSVDGDDKDDDDDDIVFVDVRFSEGDKSEVMFQACHCRRPWRCSLVIGREDRWPHVTLSFETQPLSRWSGREFTRTETKGWFVLPYAKCAEMSDDGTRIPVTIKLW